MNIHPAIIITAVISGALALFLGVMYLVFIADFSTDNNTSALVQIQQYHSASEIYKARLRDYQGMCPGLGVPAGIFCESTETTFKIWTEGKEGEYACTDHTGFVGMVPFINSYQETCS